jgi:hypothetical protein
MKCVIEPSAAVGVTVALSDQFRTSEGEGPRGAVTSAISVWCSAEVRPPIICSSISE